MVRFITFLKDCYYISAGRYNSSLLFIDSEEDVTFVKTYMHGSKIVIGDKQDVVIVPDRLSISTKVCNYYFFDIGRKMIEDKQTNGMEIMELFNAKASYENTMNIYVNEEMIGIRFLMGSDIESYKFRLDSITEIAGFVKVFDKYNKNKEYSFEIYDKFSDVNSIKRQITDLISFVIKKGD